MAERVTRDSRTRWAGWILGCVQPWRGADITLGDLEEEYRLRRQSMHSSRVSRWYWSQVARSIPVLLWASIRRGGWAAFAVAVGACIVQAAAELAMKAALSSLLVSNPRLPAFLTLLAVLPMLVLVSYLAARIRPGAATAMAGLIVIAVVIQLLAKTGADMPIWNQIVALVVGPSAALAGGVLSLRTGTDQR
jgi:hypothetical protein